MSIKQLRKGAHTAVQFIRSFVAPCSTTAPELAGTSRAFMPVTGDRMAVITVSLIPDEEPIAFTLQAWATEAQYEMVFVDSDISPWASQGYLGTLLSADEARTSELREAVFQVADLICATIPEVTLHLEAMLDT